MYIYLFILGSYIEMQLIQICTQVIWSQQQIPQFSN